MVYLMSDLELPLRDRTYREPDGPHVAVVRGRDLSHALEHLGRREDCRALAILGPPAPGPAGPALPAQRGAPDVSVLEGRRVLICSGDRSDLRSLSEACLDAGARVEWMHVDKPDFDVLAGWVLPVYGIVLAAGLGTRMGSNKLLLEVAGTPLVRHVVEAATEGGCHHVVVVYSDAAVGDVVAASATCILNPDPARGQASSLRAGLEAMPEDAAGALVLLGDQPLVGSRTVQLLLNTWRREGARPAVAASYGRREDWRPPVVLDRSLWPDVKNLTGDQGARQLLAAHPELIDTVLAAGRPDDVDTPEDYAKIVRLFPRPDPG